MDYAILINRMSPFVIQGVSGSLFPKNGKIGMGPKNGKIGLDGLTMHNSPNKLKYC